MKILTVLFLLSPLLRADVAPTMVPTTDAVSTSVSPTVAPATDAPADDSMDASDDDSGDQAAPTSATAASGKVAVGESTVPSLPEKSEKPWGHSGLVYMFSFSNWMVFNGMPLAYTPIEIGYDFGNGVRVQTAYDLVYYLGNQTLPGEPSQQFNYQMYDWRTSLIYRIPMTLRLRPIVGVSVDVVGGQQQVTPNIVDGTDLNAGIGPIPSWSFAGAGVLAGFDYFLTRDLTLDVNEHYIATFTTVASPTVTQLGLMITF